MPNPFSNVGGGSNNSGGSLTPGQDAAVQSIIDLPDNAIPLSLSDDTLGPSIASQTGMSGVMVDGEISTTKDTINIGEGISLSEDGGGIKATDKIDDVSSLAVGTLVNSNDSTGDTVAYFRTVPANLVFLASTAESNTGNLAAWFPVVGSRIARNIILRFGSVATKIRLTLRDSPNQTTTDGIVLYQSHTDAEFESGLGFDVTDAVKTLTFLNGAKYKQGRFVYASIEQHSTGTGTITIKGLNTTIAGVTQFYPALTQLVQDESTIPVAMEENITQASVLLNANFDQNPSDTLSIGALVAPLTVHEVGGVKYMEVIEEKGAITNFDLPVGIMVKAMTNSTSVKAAILIRGEHVVTLPGQDDLAIGTKLYVKKTGTGVNEKWILTHDSTGEAFFVGKTTQDAGVNMYDVHLDFSLAQAHEHSTGLAGDVIQLESNGAALATKSGTLNIIGKHHVLEQNSGDSTQADLKIDPGALMLKQSTGATLEPGRGATLGASADGSEELALNITPSGSVNDWPLFWAGETVANNAVGTFTKEGIIEKVVTRLELNASNFPITPIAAGTSLYWRKFNGIFSTTSIANDFVGRVAVSRYIEPITNYFTTSLNTGSVGISTAQGANEFRNHTVVIASGAVNGADFQIPDLNLNQVYTTPIQVGDRSAITNPNTGKTINIRQQTGGTFQNLAGTVITTYPITGNKGVVIERLSGNIWKVVAENTHIVESDIVVSIDQLTSVRTSALEAFELAQTNTNTAFSPRINASLSDMMDDMNTVCDGNTSVVIKAGECGSDNGAEVMTTNVDLTVDISTHLDTGTETASTWYYIWVMKETTGTGLRGLLSLSNSNPTILSGYTAKRLLGAVRNQANGHFRQFWAQGSGRAKKYVYKEEFLSLSNQSISSRTAMTMTSVVPNMPRGYPLITATFEYGGTGSLVGYHENQGSSFVFMTGGAGFGTMGSIKLDTEGKFRLDSNGTAAGIYMKVPTFDMEL